MFPSWRLKIREAKLAFQQGRLDEARELLDGELREYLPGKRLSQKIAGQMAARAQSRIDAGDTAAGWHDLEAAEHLADGAQDVAQVRDALVAERLVQIQESIVAGDPELAMAQIGKMESRNRLTAAGRSWKEVASRLQEAKRAAAEGHFSKASEMVQAADALLPGDARSETKTHLQKQMQQLSQDGEQFRRLNQGLHVALGNKDWSKALAVADEMLAVAPESTLARDARRQAWDAVGMKTTQLYRRRRSDRSLAAREGPLSRGTPAPAANPKVDTVTERTPAERSLLWVDGIGGFLVLHGEEIVIGQPAGQSGLDLPIQADISRRHAVIRRDGGAYVLDPVQETYLDGRRVDGAVVLADNNLISLGTTVKLRYRKPHVLSATARLEVESRHKTQPRSDGIILMADTLVLGPKGHSHIRCSEWANDVILFRRGEGLVCRTTGPLSIDGEACQQHGPVAVGSRVEGDDFSFTLEAV